MEKKEKAKTTQKPKRRVLSLSAFTIIMILIFLLGLSTYILPQATFSGDVLVNGSGVEKAKLSQILMSPVLGFADAIDIGIFIFILGAFLKVVNSTNAIEDGVKVLIKKLHGREIVLIPILMFIFSIGGTTYGMLEETVGFYALLSIAMVAAGMDTLVASAVVLLGAGSGVLGSTINPFAVGAAISALPEGMVVNQAIIIGLGTVLWLSTLLVSILFVMNYARKVIKDKGSTFLSLQEQKGMQERYGDKQKRLDVTLSKRQKLVLVLFFFTFAVMIIGFIPWADIKPGVYDFFSKHTGRLTGSALGDWYFNEASLWFLVMTVIIGIVAGMNEKKFIDTFLDGADDMVGVILIIAVARGASVLMTQTHLDNYIIYTAAEALRTMPAVIFAPLNYLLHVGLSVLVPSSSGLASLSTPIMGPLAAQVGFNVETTIMEMVAANGLVNLFTPTCGAIMGGLALARVEYTTYLKWVGKLIAMICLLNIVVLTIAMIIL